MFDFVPFVGTDFHAIVAHFPMALLTLSFAFSVLGVRWRRLDEHAWGALFLGAIAAIPATISGVVAHVPYEGTSVASAIEHHEVLGLIGTAMTVALAGWRWRARRRGADAGTRAWYRLVALVGLAWITILGGTGGDLVYGHGVNVRGINPLHSSAPAVSPER